MATKKVITSIGIECSQNNKSFYFTKISNLILKEICYVSRRDENSLKGFQRVLNESRAKAISKYMDEERGVIPSALILSAQQNSNFTFEKKGSKVTFTVNRNSFMVLDGQHRLYGMILSKKQYDVPVIIFNKLTTSEEVGLFIDINTNQKGVPTTLLLDIKNLTGRETKKEEKQRALFDKLNKDSVMAGYLSASKSQVGRITRVTFNKATDAVFENPMFIEQPTNVIFSAVKNYLQAVEKTFKKSKYAKARLTNSTLFRAVFEIFGDIMETSLKDYNNLKTESIASVLEPISRINYDAYNGSSNALLSKVVYDMKRELSPSTRYNLDLSKSGLF